MTNPPRTRPTTTQKIIVGFFVILIGTLVAIDITQTRLPSIHLFYIVVGIVYIASVALRVEWWKHTSTDKRADEVFRAQQWGAASIFFGFFGACFVMGVDGIVAAVNDDQWFLGVLGVILCITAGWVLLRGATAIRKAGGFLPRKADSRTD